MARLTIQSPQGRTERVLGDHNTLGRHPDNTVQILDRIVSKNHCIIKAGSGGWLLVDLGSLNGTYVNGQRVEKERALKTGDTINMGSTTIEFLDDADKPALARTSSLEAQDGPRITVEKDSEKSQIRTRLDSVSTSDFARESEIRDEATLRQDYEKLRIAHQVMTVIGGELDVSKLLASILNCAFEVLNADRGVILMYDDEGQLRPECVRSRRGKVEDVTISNTILQEVIENRRAVISNDASADARFNAAKSIIIQGIRASMAVPLLHRGKLLGVMWLDSLLATNAFGEKDLAVFQTMANQAAIAIQNSLFAKRAEKDAVFKDSLRRLLPAELVDRVVSGELEVKKGGELRDTTVLFSDIRGFTSMSESQDAQQVVAMLNEYFELMVEIVFKHEGTLDKFVGDEIMVLFGAPVAHDDDAFRAVSTAIEMMEALKEFNRTRAAENEVPIEIGIGINSGEVVAGYLGSSKALEYTVIGDVVNTGARLCSTAGPGEVIISETTYERVRAYFLVEELEPKQVKGKAKPLRNYKVLGWRPGVYRVG